MTLNKNELARKNIFVSDDAVIEEDVVLHPNVVIEGASKIKKRTTVYSGTTIVDSEIGESCDIKSSHIENSKVGDGVKIGPFAHIRPNSRIEDDCKIGNFIEIKNAVLKAGTKVSHLAYVGDAEIGKNCNIGCGAIFVNYNGKTKNKTIVGSNCFIGSNCNIIAPVVIADNTYVCAGTTLTVSTQAYDFVIGRSRETIKHNTAQKYLKENQ